MREALSGLREVQTAVRVSA